MILTEELLVFSKSSHELVQVSCQCHSLSSLLSLWSCSRAWLQTDARSSNITGRFKMSQAALWHVMNMFHIPDVDFLEQIYDSATVRLAPNDAESATIISDTGVAQGSITSPQLFNIFINALLQMLTATGQNQGISHGLQIGKDQDDSNQDADHGY